MVSYANSSVDADNAFSMRVASQPPSGMPKK
jgi:hypothetical protein